MSRSFRWAILGTGGIAAAFARDLKYLPDHQVAAAGSRTFQRARQFTDEFGGAPFGSYEELVRADVDAVYVATPHPMHAANSILALSAGKPVLCEKPLAINASEARSMIALAKANDLALMEAMWSRFLPPYRRIRDLVDSGRIGEIIAIYADHGQALPSDPKLRWRSPELGGGALLDLGIYPISLASFLLGKPLKIFATSTPADTGVDAQTSMIFQYQSGAQAVLTTNLKSRTACTATIVGTRGRIEVDSTFYAPTSLRLITEKRRREFPNKYQGHGLREEAAEFATLVRKGRQESSLMPWQESIEIMETMDEIRRQIGLKYPTE